ncbi:MAG: vitamin K epoxide reductase family protein [Rectinemataceae bacterium]|nr:vitamin K epoxide reductase family protein [Rectinemataceae bacterium]
MTRSLLIVLILILSFIGIADSWYLYQSAITDSALSCDLGSGLDGCNIVAQSAYSRLFGIPLGLYGVGFFALTFILAASLSVVSTRRLYQVLLTVSVFGVVASAVFVFIQFALIKALCIYCIASAGIAVLIFGLSWTLWKRFLPVKLVTVL